MVKLLSFFLCGVAQFSVDTTIFTGLAWLGVNLVLANIISRGLAACVGYYINGKFTFNKRMNKFIFFKFILYWMGMTLLSTQLIYLSKFFLTNNSTTAMLFSKVTVEVFLFFISFFIAKIWVYKK